MWESSIKKSKIGKMNIIVTKKTDFFVVSAHQCFSNEYTPLVHNVILTFIQRYLDVMDVVLTSAGKRTKD